MAGEGTPSAAKRFVHAPGVRGNPARTRVKESAITTAEPEYTAEQIGWRFTLGAIILVGAYIAWPMIPVVMALDIDPGLKAGLSGFLGATPFLSKFVAMAVMGRPAYYFLKRTVYNRLRRRFSSKPAK